MGTGRIRKDKAGFPQLHVDGRDAEMEELQSIRKAFKIRVY